MDDVRLWVLARLARLSSVLDPVITRTRFSILWLAGVGSLAITLALGLRVTSSSNAPNLPDSGLLALALMASSVMTALTARASLLSRRRWPKAMTPSLDQRMEAIISELGNLSGRLSPLIEEAARLARQAEQRAEQVARLEAEEAALRKDLVELRTMSRGQADAVTKLIAEAENRNTRQDRLYFLLGVAVTVAVSIAVLFIGKVFG